MFGQVSNTKKIDENMYEKRLTEQDILDLPQVIEDDGLLRDMQIAETIGSIDDCTYYKEKF